VRPPIEEQTFVPDWYANLGEENLTEDE